MRVIYAYRCVYGSSVLIETHFDRTRCTLLSHPWLIEHVDDAVYRLSAAYRGVIETRLINGEQTAARITTRVER